MSSHFFCILLRQVFFSPRTMFCFHRYHCQGLTFPLKFSITLSSLSVIYCSDCYHHQQFKHKPSYVYRLAGGRVATVHEEYYPPARLQPQWRWQTLRRKWWRRWRSSRDGRNEYRKELQGQLLPGTVWQHNDSVCCDGDGVVANGGRADFCGRWYILLMTKKICINITNWTR